MSLSGDLVPIHPANGIAFTGCAMQSAAATASSEPHGHGHAHARRREGVVNGKWVKTLGWGGVEAAKKLIMEGIARASG